MHFKMDAIGRHLRNKEFATRDGWMRSDGFILGAVVQTKNFKSSSRSGLA